MGVGLDRPRTTNAVARVRTGSARESQSARHGASPDETNCTRRAFSRTARRHKGALVGTHGAPAARLGTRAAVPTAPTILITMSSGADDEVIFRPWLEYFWRRVNVKMARIRSQSGPFPDVLAEVKTSDLNAAPFRSTASSPSRTCSESDVPEHAVRAGHRRGPSRACELHSRCHQRFVELHDPSLDPRRTAVGGSDSALLGERREVVVLCRVKAHGGGDVVADELEPAHLLGAELAPAALLLWTQRSNRSRTASSTGTSSGSCSNVKRISRTRSASSLPPWPRTLLESSASYATQTRSRGQVERRPGNRAARLLDVLERGRRR